MELVSDLVASKRKRRGGIAAALALILSISVLAVPDTAVAGSGIVHVWGQRCTASNGGHYVAFHGSTDGARKNASLPAYYSVNNGAWHRTSNVSTNGSFGIGSTGTITSTWPSGAGSVMVRVKIDGIIGSASVPFSPTRCRPGGQHF